MNRFLSHLVIAAMALLPVFCSHPTTIGQGGGGSEVEVVGCVYLSANEPAPATQVKLIPKDYDPSFMAAIGDSFIDTSDSQGRYAFKNIAPGIYNILAVQLKQRTRMFVAGLDVDSGTTTVPAGTLQEPGVIRMLFLGSAEHNGYLIIPGTDIAIFVAAGSREIMLDSVPAGRIPEVRYKVLGDTASISRQNVDVVAAATTTLANPSWHYQGRINFNTTAAGAGVGGSVFGFPALIRLTSDNFDFARANTDGADIRFTASNGQNLAFEIDQWDAAARMAAIWVKVDTIHGNDSSQSITMYWGNPDASPHVPGSGVFDTAAGFQGVWHLGESGNAPAADVTANGFFGNAFNMAGNGAATSGAIGNARVFDGSSSYITMPATAGGKLNFGEDDFYTLSAWVRADAFENNKYRTIAAKGFQQYFLQVSYMPGPGPLWQFATFKDTSVWNMSHTQAAENQWVLLCGVKHGAEQDLYCNGELIARSSGTSETYDQKKLSNVTILRDVSEDFTIGKFFNQAGFPLNDYCYFKGMIDEVRISSVARNADWIKLCYMNQKSDDKLVQFR